MNDSTPISTDPMDTYQRVLEHIETRAEPSRASSKADYLREFHVKFENLLGYIETRMGPDLEGRGPSEDLVHEWDLLKGQGQEFLAALAGEIERAE